MIQTPPTILLGYESRAVFAGKTCPRISRRLRRGFNFTEVLFAVMILGMGFVMVAAMFPVTIRQTAMNMEEAAGANTAKDAVEALQAIATDTAFPPTATSSSKPGKFVAITQDTTPAAWAACCRSNFISSQNPRYGWVAMYRRDLDDAGKPSPYAQVIVIAAQSRNRPTYAINDAPGVISDVLPLPSGDPPTLMARTVKVTVKTINGVSTVTFPSGGEALAAPNAYLVIADDTINPSSNGRIYQFGNFNDTTSLYELIPGADQTASDPPHTNVDALILGRGYTNPAAGDSTYSGPAQDTGIYVSFIRVVAPSI